MKVLVFAICHLLIQSSIYDLLPLRSAIAIRAGSEFNDHESGELSSSMFRSRVRLCWFFCYLSFADSINYLRCATVTLRYRETGWYQRSQVDTGPFAHAQTYR
ncbi:hypothetical protein ST37_03000 [Vibrio sp. qd031]|uniref:hypothetical protein n=1 Tax=Vibrio sp. qd031 TaxID=1603038 RepID=UPI000A10EBD2|nr:hypothetical protein [Vibrio sp. qd031]ORT52002.1 hypothetical protein ST37_03000 [Vibrio sp. qd031]